MWLKPPFDSYHLPKKRHKYIAPGTIIWSDKWPSYHGLDTVGYRHETVNHSNEFKSASGVCTNSIEGSWNAVKRSFPKMGTSKKLYEGYLAEYLMRRRHMKAFNFRFETFLDKIANVYSPKSLRSTDYDEPSNEANISEPDSDDENEDEEEEDTFRYDIMLMDKYQYVGCDGYLYALVTPDPFNTSDSLFDETMTDPDNMMNLDG